MERRLFRSIQRNHRTRARGRADIAPLISMAALAILGFLWLVVLIGAFRFEPRLRNLVLFVASLTELPVACAAIQYWVGTRCSKPARRIFESINVWCAVLVLLAVAIVGVATWKERRTGVLATVCSTGGASCPDRASCASRGICAAIPKGRAFAARGSSYRTFQPEVGADGSAGLRFRRRCHRSLPHRAREPVFQRPVQRFFLVRGRQLPQRDAGSTRRTARRPFDDGWCRPFAHGASPRSQGSGCALAH